MCGLDKRKSQACVAGAHDLFVLLQDLKEWLLDLSLPFPFDEQ